MRRANVAAAYPIEHAGVAQLVEHLSCKEDVAGSSPAPGLSLDPYVVRPSNVLPSLSVAHPKDVGDRTQLCVMVALRELGYAVSVPFGENTRYDLVVDDGETLQRVQCKTGRLRGGAVRFATCSTYGHHRNPGMAREATSAKLIYSPSTAPKQWMST